MEWNWNIIVTSMPALLKGLLVTVELTVISCILGLLVGAVMALLRLHKNKFISAIPFTYVFFFRGTPLLVQMFLIYHGASQFLDSESFLWEKVFKEAFWCALIAFTLNTGAYIAEIIRGAIQSIPKGELEAAEAIGMSPIQKLIRIILPRAFGIMIPAYSNEVIFMLKGSSLAMAITMMDITGVANTISARTYTVFELYFAAGMLYLILTWVILFAFRILEKRFNHHNHYTPHTPPEAMAGAIGKI